MGMHNQIFKRRKRDQAHGWFWGNVCLGASAEWWRDEHFEHHAFTNTFMPDVGCTDPQQHEAPLWAQDPVLLPYSSRFLVRFQHLTFVPLLVVVGRFGLIFASYTMQKGMKEHVGTALHWGWIAPLLYVVGSQHGVWHAFAF